MSAWTEKLIATYTLAQIQDQAKQFGIKNVKKFTKAELADKIEETIEAANSATDDKTKEQDMNDITEATDTVEVTPIVGTPEELIALLNATADDEVEIVTDEVDIELESDAIAAGIMGEHEAKGTSIPVITTDEVANILEDSVADVPGENETEVAPKLTAEYIEMLDAVRANAAKRKHMLWNTIIAQAENEPLAQIAGKANTVRGILWKIGKHLEPMIEAYDKQEALLAEQAAAKAAELEAAKMGE